MKGSYKLLTVMIYDVTEDKRRTKLFHLLKQYGVPIQKSAFEGKLSMRERDQIIKEIQKIIDYKTDRFVLYTVGKEQETNIRVVGLERPELPEKTYFLI